MSDEPIHQPHDKLFKGTFGQPANAAGFLRWQLPAALASNIDWDRLDEAVWDESLLLHLPKETLELLIRYILNADIDKAAFDRKVQNVSHSDVRTTAMSLAQQLRQEGRQEGRHEGRQELVIENLRLRFGFAPQGLIDAIAAIHDEAQLLRLHRASIQAASLEEFSSVL
jgi:predicted transposase YdaD